MATIIGGPGKERPILADPTRCATDNDKRNQASGDNKKNTKRSRLVPAMVYIAGMRYRRRKKGECQWCGSGRTGNDRSRGPSPTAET